MKLKFFVFSIAMAMCSFVALAENDTTKVEEKIHIPLEEDPIFQLKFDVRMDAEATFFNDPEEAGKDADFGFQAKYIMLCANGQINKHFSYQFRYRMKAGVRNGGGFDFHHTLDWANITYSPTVNWHITFGQQTIDFGGYEYDRNPIDVYFASLQWNTVRGFRPGITGKYVTTNGNHRIHVQVLTSDLYREPATQKDFLMGYNILWAGHMGWFNTRYSLNFEEYRKGEFMNKIYLGNKLNFNIYSLELDYVNRYTFDQERFFQDFSIIANNIFSVGKRWNIFVKGGYEQNYANNGVSFADGTCANYLAPGTSYYFYGAGFEYYPLITDNNNLRIHFTWSSNNGIEIDHVRQLPLGQTFSLGIRWNMKVVDRRKALK